MIQKRHRAPKARHLRASSKLLRCQNYASVKTEPLTCHAPQKASISCPNVETNAPIRNSNRPQTPQQFQSRCTNFHRLHGLQIVLHRTLGSQLIHENMLCKRIIIWISQCQMLQKNYELKMRYQLHALFGIQKLESSRAFQRSYKHVSSLPDQDNSLFGLVGAKIMVI
jgi:hypothetical protein